ncbi:MAG: ribonuclease P protein component [Gammaproteobacteria bacterium]|nr:ribonuclease P protein component [Gammaproteobacteria bacterium]MCW8971946.1 ribonuclease P protein component [Gammaproteobacteria bacterium]MCW8992014.1 ribonuclease P protein component [Gammaproteobacteria bacterium]
MPDTAGNSPGPNGPGCFTRSLRLLKPDDFKRVFTKACKLGGQYLTILARTNDLGHPRLGLAISRKHVKTAVGRNLIKRQVRESFRLHQDIIGHFDVVVLGKPGVERLKRDELRRLLDKYWQELAERCEKS